MSSVSPSEGSFVSYAKPLNELESDMRDETRKIRQNYNDRIDEIEAASRRDIKRNVEKSDEALQTVREGSAENRERDREEMTKDIEKARAQLYDRYGRAQADVIDARRKAENQVRDYEQITDHRLKDLNEMTDQRINKLATATEQREAETAHQEHLSRERETDQLRKEVNDLTAVQRGSYIKEKGQGTVDAYRELENENRQRVSMLDRQYDNQINNLKERNTVAERHASELLDQTARDKDYKYTGYIKELNDKHQGERKDLQNQAEDVLKAEAVFHRAQEEAIDRKFETQAQQSAESKTDALSKQQKVFKEEMHNVEKDYQTRIGTLQKELQHQRTSDDETYISPAAETKFKRSVADAYEKSLNAEVARNDARTQGLQQRYSESVQAANQDSDRKVHAIQSQRVNDEHIQQQAYMDTVNEMQRGHDFTLRNKDIESEHRAQTLERTYESSLDHERRNWEDLLNDTKMEAETKIADLREKADFDAKTAQRDFSMRQAELIRGYEKKMEEQKIESDSQIMAVKEDLARSHNSSERRTKQMLDDQAKAYDQKIAQIEYTNKERERNMRDNYEDQIDKLKRSNALIIQRRS